MATTATKDVIVGNEVRAELSPDGDRVRVKFNYHPDRVRKIKKVPSAFFVSKEKDTQHGPFWRLNLETEIVRRLRQEFGDDLVLGTALKKWGSKAMKKERNLTDLSQADDATLKKVPKNLTWQGLTGDKKKLRPYQRADIKFMSTTNVINANQPGAGKTAEVVLALVEAEMEYGCHLVFAPLTSLETAWADEIRSLYKALKLEEPVILTGETPDQRKEAIMEAKELADEGYAFWLILNPHMGRMERVAEGSGDNIKYHEELKYGELAEIDWDSMTVDEFHLMGLGNPDTLGFRGMNYIREVTQPTRVFAMSGTPMGGKPIKLWGGLHFLDQEEFTSRWHWARTWLIINVNGYGSNIEGIMPGREVDFYNHLKPYLVRRTKREALPGLPPKQRINVWCDMTPKQKNQYKVFETEAEWRLSEAEEDGRLTANNILTEYMRLKQFADAYCEVKKTGKELKNGLPELKVTQTKDSGKLAQLIEKLDEEGVTDPDGEACAVIASQFKGMINMVAKKLMDEGIKTELITGDTKQSDRTRIKREFQGEAEPADGKQIRVVCINTKAGGTAITLDRADSVHLLDETWNPDDQEQVEDRIHRASRNHNVRCYYYRSKESVELYVHQITKEKELNNRTILDLRRRMQKLAEEREKAAA